MYANSARLTNWLSALAFSVLIAFCVISVGTWRVHDPSFVSVHSADLAPLLRQGDAVMTHSVKLAAIQPGDIISYYDPQNTQQTHTQRVGQINRTAGNFTPVSTNPREKSQPIDSSLLIGKVQYHMSKLGYILDFTQSRIGLVICAYLPALFIISQELKQLAIAYDRPTYRLFIPSRRT